MGFWQNIFYNKSIRRLRQMLHSVRMRDYSLQYNTEKLTGEERELAEEINAVIHEFRQSERRHEGETHFYDALLSKVDSILIATDSGGRVRWMNRAAIERLCGFRFETLESLSALHPTLPERLKELRKGSDSLISFTLPDGEERQYAASLTHIFVSGICYKLYSLQSVATILKQSEINAQQRLIRVLTHEIMNSLTPIISLSSTLTESLAQGSEPKLSDQDAHLALTTINRRANGLMQFVQRYRRLSGTPAPNVQRISVEEFIQGVKEIFATQEGLQFNINCGTREISIDRPQMEQVFINLLKNAIDTGATSIVVTATVGDDGRWFVASVEDNGGGFSAEAGENLFTPFFTTKKDGEGIGLAVCRQIVSNHGGLIAAERIGTQGARFTVRLPLVR